MLETLFHDIVKRCDKESRRNEKQQQLCTSMLEWNHRECGGCVFCSTDTPLLFNEIFCLLLCVKNPLGSSGPENDNKSQLQVRAASTSWALITVSFAKARRDFHLSIRKDIHHYTQRISNFLAFLGGTARWSCENCITTSWDTSTITDSVSSSLHI